MIVVQIRKYFFSYFYLLFVLIGFSQMVGINGGWTIAIYLSFLLSITLLSSIDYKFVDIVVVFFVVYCIGTYFINNDYPFDLFICSIRDQIAPMSFYLFARSRKMKECDMINNMVFPLMFAYIVGFYLFFRMPGWYMDYKLNGEYNMTIGHFYNVTRFSSFWSSSYFVGYSSLFVIIYYLCEKVFHQNKLPYFKSVLLISSLSLFFAQQKVSIAFACFFLILLSMFVFKKRIIKMKYVYASVLVFFFGCIFLLYYVTTYMDKEYLEFLIERYFEHDDGMIADRIGAYESFLSSISFWGAGLGKYGHKAVTFDMLYIPDCEYIRTLNELGIFGMSVFLFIILLSYLYAFNKRRVVSFEVLCVLFYLIAMIGATPLEVSQQQPFMLWYCLGKIHSYG